MVELIIDLKDLLLKILLQWRKMIVAMVAFALLLNGLGILRSYQSVQATLQAQTPQEVDEKEQAQQLQELKEKLDEQEVSSVHFALEAYQSYLRQYNSITSYLTNSIKMDLNSSAVPTLTVQYYVDNHYEAVYPVVEANDNTSAILSTYTSRLVNEEICQSISKALDWDVDAPYIQELLSVYTSGDMLVFAVIAPSQEDCETIADVLDRAVARLTPDIQELMGDFTITLSDWQYCLEINSGLLSSQQSQTTLVKTLRDNMNNLTSNMTEDEKNYYTALLESTHEEAPADVLLGPEETEEALALSVTPQVQYLHPKFLLLGAAAGVFVIAAWTFLAYCFAPRLRVGADAATLLHAPLLGVLPNQNTGKKHLFSGIDRWLCRLLTPAAPQFSNQERLQMIASGIRLSAEKAGMSRIFLTGSTAQVSDQSVIAQLAELLKPFSLSVSCGRSVLYDPASLEALANSDGVVFVESTGHTLYADLEQEYNACRLHQVPVIGCVVLK